MSILLGVLAVIFTGGLLAGLVSNRVRLKRLRDEIGRLERLLAVLRRAGI